MSELPPEVPLEISRPPRPRRPGAASKLARQWPTASLSQAFPARAPPSPGVTPAPADAACINRSMDGSDAIKTQLDALHQFSNKMHHLPSCILVAIALHSATHAFQETHDVKKLIEQVDE